MLSRRTPPPRTPDAQAALRAERDRLRAERAHAEYAATRVRIEAMVAADKRKQEKETP